jgi:hypothetical protein
VNSNVVAQGVESNSLSPTKNEGIAHGLLLTIFPEVNEL